MNIQNRSIVRAFKGKGLSLSVDATRALTEVLSNEENSEESLNAILDAIRERIEKREINSSVIGLEIIKSVVSDLSSSADDLALESTQLLNAYNYPELIFDEKQKMYKIITEPHHSLYGSPESRAKMYRNRLLLVQQRLLRSGYFSIRGLEHSISGDKYELSTIASLLGGKGINTLLGLLTQPEEGQWYLEDLNGMIALDFSLLQSTNILVTEGCVVLLVGVLLEGKFRVQSMATPPAEERELSLSAIGPIDIFGNNTRPSQMLQMLEMEENSKQSMFIFLSDIHLDQPHVCENLRKIFSGYQATIEEGGELVFIFMGPFAGRGVLGGRQAISTAMESVMTNLGDIICEFPLVKEKASFILIPALGDAGAGSVLPLRPLSSIFTAELMKRVPRVTLASNPCKLRFYTQEILIFRYDLLSKMQRYSVLPVTSAESLSSSSSRWQEEETASNIIVEDEEELTEKLIKCLFDQSHLFPLPPTATPIIWDLDYTLRLFPIPNICILSDSSETFHHTYKGCQATSPGSFSVDSSFLVYRPSESQIELSHVS